MRRRFWGQRFQDNEIEYYQGQFGGSQGQKQPSNGKNTALPSKINNGGENQKAENLTPILKAKAVMRRAGQNPAVKIGGQMKDEIEAD